MAVENSKNELLLPNTDCHGECNKANASSKDPETGENSAEIYSRPKRGFFAVLGAFMLLKDTYYYINGLVNPTKSTNDYLQEALDGIKQNYDAINRNYNAIQNVEAKVDRNFHALGLVFDLVNSTLTAVEKTRLAILQKIRKSEINDVVFHLSLNIDHFTTEMKKIEGLSEKEHIDTLLANNDLIKDLEDARKPKQDSLHTFLHNIIYQDHAIPENGDDKDAFSALDALYYGTQTYVSVMFFLLEQYTYLADYFYRSDDINKFNEYFNLIIKTFDNFKHSILISEGYNKKSLINDVINVYSTVRNKNFIRYENEISSELSERLESLKSIKEQLEGMELPVMRDEPAEILGNLEFVEPDIPTPIGEWKEGAKVSYAIQYRNKGFYSKVGKWSYSFEVSDKANPLVRVPTDKKNGKSRVLFRKFNNANAQLVGVLEDETETNFRDIDRDLYNAALRYDKNKAIKEVNIYVQSGANISAQFDNGRRAIHAAAQRDNTQIANDFFINNSSTDMLNVKDSDGYTPMHLSAAAGHNNFIQFLIEKGANINERTYSDELTPLHIAAYKGFTPTVEALMRSSEIDLNVLDKKGFTPLHSAVFSGLHVVQALVLNENVDINAKSNISLTALHMSSIENYPDITETLVKSDKIDVNTKTLGNFTALHFASIFGHIEIVKLLINKKETDINAQSVNHWTALHYSIALNKENVVSELLKVNSINVNIPADDNITALHLAAITGKNDVITTLLEKKADVEAQTSNGFTALHLAAMQGNHEIVSTLIDNGANIDGKTSSGLTPLLLAASSKNTTVETVKILLEKGANLTEVGNNGESYPWIAPKSGTSDVVNLIVSEDEDYYLQDENGNYFLHYAAEGGNTDAVKYLIEKEGTYVNIKNFNNETPLHFAAKSGNLQIVQYLVEKQRASIDAMNNNNKTPLHFAAEKGNSDIGMYLLVEKGAYVDEELVLSAAKGGSYDLVKYLIEKRNMNVNARGKNNESVLHLAARSGNLQLVKYLIEEEEANIFARNIKHERPLNFAIQSGNLELVKYLAEKTLGGDIEYSDIDVSDIYGKTPLYYAIRSNNLDFVKYLVNLGAADQLDKIPLHFAVESANVDIVKYLLSIGANINYKGYQNRTPLHIALMRNDLHIIQCILDKGEIDVTAKDKFNITYLHLAAHVNLDVVKYLVEKGADINAKRQGELCSTPLCFAIKVGDFEIVKYLIKEGANIDVAVNPEYVSFNLLKNKKIDNLDTLHFAVSANNSDIVKYLVQEGAEPNKPPWNGFLLLIIAATKSNLDLVQYFVEKGSELRDSSDQYPILPLVAKAGNLDIVKFLIDKGLNPNVKDVYGETTLHSAAESGNVDLVKYLLETEGMNPNDKDYIADTPLQSAIENGKLDATKYLIEKTEVDINYANKHGYTFLHASAKFGDLNLVKYLIDRGADVNANKFFGITPLHLAANEFHINVVKYLVKNNANINALNGYQEIPLHNALSHYFHQPRTTASSYTLLKQYVTVRYLVEQGSDLSIKDEDGRTFESIAYGNDLRNIISFLREYMLSINVRDAIKEGIPDDISEYFNEGANLGFKDKNDWTLLHFAAEKGHLNVTKFLLSKGANLYAQDKKNKTPSDIATDNHNYKLARYFENVKYSTENHYHKRDTAQHVINDQSLLIQRNTAKQLSSSLRNNIIGSESNATSGASKPFSWINMFAAILLDSVKSITSFSYSSRPTISVEYFKPSTAVKTKDIDANSTLFLLDLIIKKVSGQKYIYAADTSMSLAEANGYTIDIVCLFERAVRQAALYSKISLHRLNIDFMEVQKDCIGKVLGKKNHEIPEILKLHVEKAFPGRVVGCSGKLSMKKYNKFTDEFNKALSITMSQWMQNTLQNNVMTEKVMEGRGQELVLECKKYLSNSIRVQ